jgi:hypothetical protein
VTGRAPTPLLISAAVGTVINLVVLAADAVPADWALSERLWAVAYGFCGRLWYKNPNFAQPP